MADIIREAVKELNPDTSVKCWQIAYTVEDSGKENSFMVVVTAEEMTDPTDAAEAKTLANVKAAEVKSAWVASLASATSTVKDESVEGEVTL